VYFYYWPVTFGGDLLTFSVYLLQRFWQSALNFFDVLVTIGCCVTLVVLAFARCGTGATGEEVLDTLLLVARNVLQFVRLAGVLRQYVFHFRHLIYTCDTIAFRLGYHLRLAFLHPISLYSPHSFLPLCITFASVASVFEGFWSCLLVVSSGSGLRTLDDTDPRRFILAGDILRHFQTHPPSRKYQRSTSQPSLRHFRPRPRCLPTSTLHFGRFRW
jgi:hypothetical protein